MVVWALGSAAGGPRRSDVHGPRLERMLERLVDTPVRGFVYEAARGTAGAEPRRWAGRIAAQPASAGAFPCGSSRPTRRLGDWVAAMRAAVAD